MGRQHAGRSTAPGVAWVGCLDQRGRPPRWCRKDRRRLPPHGGCQGSRLECDRDRSPLGLKTWHPVLLAERQGHGVRKHGAGAGGHRLGHGRALDGGCRQATAGPHGDETRARNQAHASPRWPPTRWARHPASRPVFRLVPRPVGPADRRGRAGRFRTRHSLSEKIGPFRSEFSPDLPPRSEGAGG